MIPVMDFGLQPLANDFCKEGEERAGYAPLKVLFCPRCTLAQLSIVVRPEILYSRYAYFTSTSQTIQNHFDTLAQDIMAETEGRELFEIGCNDGRGLRHFKDLGFAPVYGMDPAQNLCEVAKTRYGIDAICCFFSEKVQFPTLIGLKPDVVLARHVFCHVDNWAGFVRGLENVSRSDTLVCIEVPYAVDQLQTGSFDQCYHEHLSYLTLRAMVALLKDSQFHLHRIIRYNIHGGVILMMLRHNLSGIAPDASVQEFIAKEQVTETHWKDMDWKMRTSVTELQRLVFGATGCGKRVCAYGASAKATVLLNLCRFTKKQIAFVTDTTTTKLYRNVPGTDIPVVDEGALIREQPDYALLTAWNYEKEIITKEKWFNGKWIVPMPTVHVI